MADTLTGWLFDCYPSPRGITLWLIDQNGDKRRGFCTFTPSFFLHLNPSDARRAENLAVQCPVPVTITRTVKTEIYSGDPLDVLEVHVHDPMRFRDVVWYYERYFPHFAFFNSDILVAQLFLYATKLFPLAFGDYEFDDQGALVGWTLNDSREATDYQLPPFSILLLRNANDFVPPKYQKHLQLEVTYDDRTYSLEQETPQEVLEALNWHLHRCDPDIILTDYGDAVLMPKLTAMAQRHKVPLLLNRDEQASYVTTKESSFFQYGKIIHKDGAFELAGRWHIDAANSMTVAEADLDGLFEMARLTQMCGQRQGRASIGTSMSSLQLSWAYQKGILIPSKKREPEDFKSAATLLLADRGGLIFNPPLGITRKSPNSILCRCIRPSW